MCHRGTRRHTGHAPSQGDAPSQGHAPSRGTRSLMSNCQRRARPSLDECVADLRQRRFLSRWHTAYMRSRSAGMWWGVAIEAPDPKALANFYSELLGWPVTHEEPGTAILAAPEGSIYVVFQEASGYEAPEWPPLPGKQRPMMHLDFQVDDLDSAVADAVALGATVAGHQPQQNVRVLLDPAGHPFCFCREEG